VPVPCQRELALIKAPRQSYRMQSAVYASRLPR
jgi:hypothetical protein